MLSEGDRFEFGGIWATVSWVVGKDVQLNLDDGGWQIGPWAYAEPAVDAPPCPTLDPADFSEADMRSRIATALESDTPGKTPKDPWMDATTLSCHVALAFSNGQVGRPGDAFTAAVATTAATMASENVIAQIDAGVGRPIGNGQRRASGVATWLSLQRAKEVEAAHASARAELLRWRDDRAEHETRLRELATQAGLAEDESESIKVSRSGDAYLPPELLEAVLKRLARHSRTKPS